MVMMMMMMVMMIEPLWYSDDAWHFVFFGVIMHCCTFDDFRWHFGTCFVWVTRLYYVTNTLCLSHAFTYLMLCYIHCHASCLIDLSWLLSLCMLCHFDNMSWHLGLSYLCWHWTLECDLDFQHVRRQETEDFDHYGPRVGSWNESI
jgi:hypothetical protein